MACGGGWEMEGDAPLHQMASELLPLCLNPSINTKEHSANNTSHSHEFFFPGWLRENA